MGVDNRITPEILKTIIRAPPVSQASRNEPGPKSANEVTTITFPLRPPGVYSPPPTAPGKAGISAFNKSSGFEAHGLYGRPDFSSCVTIGSAFSHAMSDFISHSLV